MASESRSDASASNGRAGSTTVQPPVHDGPEPIAIVGMGCRLPGESETPDQFWDMLLKERYCYSEPPKSRFNIDGFHSKKKRPGSIKPRGGYFASGIHDFDPPFFGITKTEAEAMDPQQRKLLECVYEAFEMGGIPLEKVSGSNTAVYVGNFVMDYAIMNLKDGDYPRPYAMTGQGLTILSNRVSYVYNLHGPSFTLDTACSSSIYAAHLACRALQSGEVDGALICGTNLIQSIEVHMGTDSVGVLSATSTCHTFDASADGYGRGEGVGAIYVKRLSDALRDGDPIRGVIRGTSANANGKTSGITQPSAIGQEKVIRDAYAFAKLDFKDTGYVESHGTGTPVGDPIELNGIGNVFLPDGTQRESLLIGGVKPNVGHAEAASAIASMIKVAYALEHGKIPATIGIKNFNKKINFRDGKMQVVQKARDWPAEFDIRRASVSSFGYGGANGHAIMEAASSILPGYESFKTRATSRKDFDLDAKTTGTMGSGKFVFKTKSRTQFVLPFSAHDAPTLKANIASIRQVVDDYDAEDLAYTLAARRSRFFHRGYAVVEKSSIGDDLEEEAITIGKRGNGANIAMVFTGQGAQTAQMGKDLMQDFPSYLQTIRDLDAVLKSLGSDAPSWSIEQELLKPKAHSSIDQVHLSQPLCTAVQVALFDLLRSWGITPQATVGHSSGAIGAAYACGAITKNEAILYAYFRGVAVSGLVSKGQMLAVGLGAEEVEPYLEEGVRIACHNSPQSVTLSGDEDVAARVQAKLEKEKIFVRPVKTSGRAYHSHHMAAVGGTYLESLQRALQQYSGDDGSRVAEKDRAIYSSSVFGKIMGQDFVPGPEYWKQNLESPVMFTQALEALLTDEDLGINTIIEVGPHSALAGPIRQIRDKMQKSSKDLEYIASLVRGENATTRLLDLAGALFIKGHGVNLEIVNATEQEVDGKTEYIVGKPLVDLPRYNWNYKNGANIRTANRLTEEHRLRKFPRHDLLGVRLPGSVPDQRQWRNMVDLAELPWLTQHCLGQQPVLPGTGYLAIAVEAARQFFSELKDTQEAYRIHLPHVSVKAGLNFPPAGTSTEIMTTMSRYHVSDSVLSTHSATFTISSQINDVWTEHARGIVEIKPGVSDMAPIFREEKLQEPKTSHTWYRGFSSIDLNYGPAFNGLTDIRVDPWCVGCTALTNLAPTDCDPDDSRYLVHPGTLDTCLQTIIIAGNNGSLKNLTHSHIPTAFEDVTFWSHNGTDIPELTPGKGRILTTGTKYSLRSLVGQAQLFDDQGRPLFYVSKVESTAYAERLGSPKADRHPYLRVVWKADIDQPNALTSKANIPPSLLSTWANSLTSAAKAHPNHPVGKAILEALDGQYDFDEKAALDLGSGSVGPVTFELESIVLSTLQRLSQPPRPVGEVLPGSLEEILDLLLHKKPGLDVMFFAEGSNFDDSVRILENTMGGKSSLKRYRTVDVLTTNRGQIPSLTEKLEPFRQVSVKEGDLGSEEGDAAYDLVVVPRPSSAVTTPEDIHTFIENVTKKLKPNGRILLAEGRRDIDAATSRLLDTIVAGVTKNPANDPVYDAWVQALERHNIHISSGQSGPSGWTILSEGTPKEQKTSSVVLLSRHSESEAAKAFQTVFENNSIQVTRASLDDTKFTAASGATFVSIVEFGDNLFETLNETEFANLQALAEAAASIFWVTSGNLLGSDVNAHAGTVFGLGRCLQSEHPSLHFFTVDLDHKDAELGASQVAQIVAPFDPQGGDVDKEYIIKDGAFHLSRLSEDKTLDALHTLKIANEPQKIVPSPAKPIRLAIERPGAMETMHYIPDERDNTLSGNQVEVEIKAVGMNMKEVATFQGTFNSKSLSHEGAGIVRRVAPGVTSVAVGDRVCFVGMGLFSNVERFDAMYLRKMLDTESFEELASMPLAYSTAVYSLLHLGRLRKGEKVLIHSATGGVGLAAIQIAKMVGAEIYATVGTADKRAYLKEHHGLDEKHVFNSRDTSFASDIRALCPNGIDVCLNSLVRDRLHASWNLLAIGGRHIEIGRTDIMDYGSLAMEPFKRCATFSAFDYGILVDQFPELPGQILEEVLQYYREGKIQPPRPLDVHSAGDIGGAFKQFLAAARIGKVVVKFDDQPVELKEKPAGAKFKADGTYLLVGCLGGLGRCLSRWMVDNGARNLTYIARSGASTKEAARFVETLRTMGVTVNIVKGDVSNLEDVKRCVEVAGVPVYGMVQGAMALQDFLFSKLDLAKWNYAVNPKIRGTINLHEALKDQPLDFFVMLSSGSAMTGAPTQSNYCAGNTFMDHFARHRKQQGLPATSVALAMVLEVGFVSQDEKIEQGISRGGISGIVEKEFIELMETAMLPAPDASWKGDDNANCFLVSGLDPTTIRPDALSSGFRFWSQPRIGPLAVAIEERSPGFGNKKSGAVAVLDRPTILEAVKARFAKTFMVSEDDIDETKPLVSYGMDSMIGIALRNWVFGTYAVDVPTSDFMGPLLTASSLADKIFNGLGL